MKLLLTAIILFSSIQSLACQPPPRAWMQQSFEIQSLLSSSELGDLLMQMNVQRITEIKTTNNGYKVLTGTLCSVVATPIYVVDSKGAPGRCSQYQGMKLEQVCEYRE